MTDTMRRHAVVLALAFSLAPVALQSLNAQQPLNPPLKNWAAPLYWAPTPAEAEQRRIEQRIAHPDVSSSVAAQAASIFTAPGPMTFIAMTPCRVMDTRSSQGFTGAFGPPSLAANVARQVPMPTSTTCTIPSNAGAYSLNITAVSPGVLSFLSVWPAGQAYPNVSTLNDSSPSGGAVANAAIVPAGTLGAIQMLAGNVTDVIIDINGYYAAPSDSNENTAIGTGTLSSNTSGTFNTANGYGALQNNTTGGANTATGDAALYSNTTGSSNTAAGTSALGSNTTGSSNTAVGRSALLYNTTGSNNTASGASALLENTTGGSNTATGQGALIANTIGNNNTAHGQNGLAANTTGSFNTASGVGALFANTTGNNNTASGDDALVASTTGGNNTAIGDAALASDTTGSNNIAIGFDAAVDVSGGNSNNIHIGSVGVSGDSAAIRIGTQGTQMSAFIAGISGATSSGGIEVFVNSNGQLGASTSSRRFKEQITDMGDSSSKLFQLRPVNFFYKPEYDDGSHLLQYGLIAEEVAKVYPEMVAYDNDGQILSVRYQMLAPMLLNEVQKQNAQIRSLEERLAALEALLSGQASTAVRPAGSQ